MYLKKDFIYKSVFFFFFLALVHGSYIIQYSIPIFCTQHNFFLLICNSNFFSFSRSFIFSIQKSSQLFVSIDPIWNWKRLRVLPLISWSNYWAGWKSGNFQKCALHLQQIHKVCCSFHYSLSCQYYQGLKSYMKKGSKSLYSQENIWQKMTLYIFLKLTHWLLDEFIIGWYCFGIHWILEWNTVTICL